MKTVQKIFAVIGIAVLLFWAQADRALACEEDTIDSVSDGGEVITMISGHVFQIDPADQADTSLWLSAEDVVICDDGNSYEIINKDESGETVEAELLR